METQQVIAPLHFDFMEISYYTTVIIITNMHKLNVVFNKKYLSLCWKNDQKRVNLQILVHIQK